MYDRS
jgi:hypothetical protein